MKKSLFALAALAAAGVAQAQSSVTLYGIVDAGVRYGTHAGANAGTNATATSASNSNLSLTSGMSASRWGMSGTEDLGGGLKAIFNLENRFSLDNGQFAIASGADGSEFRQAWVGLSTAAGNVTFGRQYSLVFDTVTSSYSSFGYSPYIEVFKPEVNNMLTPGGGTFDGAIVNNSIKYAANFSGVKVGVQYGLGEKASNAGGNVYGTGSTLGVSAGYAMGPVAVGGAVEQVTDATNIKSKVYTLGGSFVAGPAKLNAGWISRSVATATDNTNHNNFSTFFGGVAFQATPALNVGGQLWYTKADKNAYVGANQKLQGAVVVDYALSKRTDAYFETDYTLRAAKDTTTDTFKKPFGAMVGVRHRF